MLWYLDPNFAYVTWHCIVEFMLDDGVVIHPGW